ncbi:hypothetical protein ElyMa_003294400 [Elysia marginata]|uniref:Uncharacterized protein n=1 Tax=Elysia marginata TaxID=1093978 RepID=A0AAV4JCX2_9GAST|nr:hypothetical protein ElyMa_003294400 [Elysia marginata]
MNRADISSLPQQMSKKNTEHHLAKHLFKRAPMTELENRDRATTCLYRERIEMVVACLYMTTRVPHEAISAMESSETKKTRTAVVKDLKEMSLFLEKPPTLPLHSPEAVELTMRRVLSTALSLR